MKSGRLLFLCVFFCFTRLSLPAQTNVSDSLALVDIYNSTNGPNWKRNSYWLSPKPVSYWKGVTVVSNRVVALDLSYNKLNGTLPASIGNLNKLTNLRFTGNSLRGKLPSTMGNLASLTELDLSQNSFSGRIPGTLGDLQNLTVCDFGSNQFTVVPDSLGSLTNLVYFYLSSNKFTGPIPSWIGNFTKLKVLWLQNNAFSGPLPGFIYTFSSLTYLQADHNQLTGNLSANIKNLQNLFSIIVSFNQLSGSLPTEIASLPALNQLFLDNNNFSGQIPADWSVANNIQNFQLHHNAFTGPLPKVLFKQPLLTGLDVSYNNLSGELPLSLGPSLFAVNISHNNITSSANFRIPDSSPEYTVYDFSYNRFTFNGLESVQQKITNPTYAPQASLSIHKKANGALAVYAGGNLANNTYTWTNTGTAAGTVVRGDSTFKPSASGQYTVSVTNAIATKLTLYSDTVAYQAAAPSVVLSVTPNPAKDYIVLSGLPATGSHTVTVTDASGLVKMQVTSAGSATVRINISSLQKGNYYIKLADAGAAPAGTRFIKN